MKYFLLRLAIGLMSILVSSHGYAQFTEKLRSTRPGEAVSPFITGRNVFQLESGFTYGRASGNNRHDVATLKNSTLLRWGLRKNFELDAAFDLQRDQFMLQDTFEYVTSGFKDVRVGLKYQMRQGSRNSPTIAFQASALLHFLEGQDHPRDFSPSFLLVLSQPLSSSISLVGNVGFDWNNLEGNLMGKYAIHLQASLTDRLNFVAENQGHLSADALRSYFISGISYNLKNDFEVDIGLGYEYYERTHDVFLGLGFSWRFMKEYYYYQEYEQ